MKKSLGAGIAVAALLAFSGAASAQIKIGLTGPITGPNAAFGKQLQNGAEQAAAAINAAGGMNGQKIELVITDDVSKPEQGVSIANKYFGDGIKFVVGPFNSGVTIPSSSKYAEYGILQITPSATNPSITERGLWNTFRTCGRDDQQGGVAGAYLGGAMKAKKVAIVHDKTPYGKGLADETQKAYNKLGGKEVLYEGVNVGEKDFAALVSKIKQAGAEIVYWGGLHTEGALITKQLKDGGVTAILMSGDGIASNEFATIGGDSVIGTKMTFPPDPRKRPEATAALAQFKAINYDPEAYTLYSYAALQVVVQAANAIKSNDPKLVAAEMHKGGVYKTVIGDLKYDSKGDITRPDYTTYTWKKDDTGKVTYIED